MEQKELLYEGKGKKLYKTSDENLLLSFFKDDLTAFNAEKKGSESGKGALNCKISTEIFKLLEKHGINPDRPCDEYMQSQIYETGQHSHRTFFFLHTGRKPPHKRRAMPIE